jgi:hypothetical protein
MKRNTMKVPHTNETQNFQHVGGVTIPPGETRDVDASLLPGHVADAPALDAEPLDHIAELLKGSVKAVTGEFGSMFDEELEHMAKLETAGQNRKSMIEAIVAEQLTRATKQADKAAQGGA